MLKLNYIDKIETRLHKVQIEEKLKEIVLEDHFFNIFTAGKKLCHAEFKENLFSFFYLSIGKHDMLSPRIHMTILEKEGGSICNLYYSKTWGFWCLFIWWNLFWGICLYQGALSGNIFKIMCCATIYIFGFFCARKHRISICKKVVSILINQLTSKDT